MYMARHTVVFARKRPVLAVQPAADHLGSNFLTSRNHTLDTVGCNYSAKHSSTAERRAVQKAAPPS